MRLLAILVLLIFIAAGIVLGALNADLVGYDLAFAQRAAAQGCGLAGGAWCVGWLLGGLTAWLGAQLPPSSAGAVQERADRQGAAGHSHESFCMCWCRWCRWLLHSAGGPPAGRVRAVPAPRSASCPRTISVA